MNYWESDCIGEHTKLTDKNISFIDIGLMIALSDEISEKDFPAIYLIENEIIVKSKLNFFEKYYKKVNINKQNQLIIERDKILKRYSINDIIQLIEEDHRQLKHIYGCMVPICIIREIFINLINSKNTNKLSKITCDLECNTIIGLIDLCNPTTTISQLVTKILKEYLDNVEQ